MLRGETELADPFAKQLVLGLGLLFLGKQGAVEATVEVRSKPQQSKRVYVSCSISGTCASYSDQNHIGVVQSH